MPIRRRPYYRAAKQSYSVYKNTRPIQINAPYQNDGFQNNNIIRSAHTIICQNATNNGNYIPPVMKVKHVKVQCTIPPVVDEIIRNCLQIRFVVLYLPEGMNFTVAPQINQDQQQLYITRGTLDDHPEWIMGERVINFNSTGSTLTSINCRINRNLKSGDMVVLAAVAYFTNNMNAQVHIPIIASTSYACRSN